MKSRPTAVLGLLLLVLVGAAFVLLRPEAHKRVVVRMWTFPMLPELRDAELYAEMRRDFRKEHPEIDVQVETLPWGGRMQKMITAIAGNRAPDAVYLNLDFMTKFIEMKLPDGRSVLQPVDQFLTPEEKNDYDATVIDGVSQDGKMWLFPMLRTATSGIYNKTLFREAGLDPEKPPETWEELESVAKALTKPQPGPAARQWGLSYFYGGDSLNLSFWPLLWQAGGDVLTPDGKRAAFDSPAGIEAAEFIVRQYRNGYIPPSNINLGGNEFSSGKVGYWFGATQFEAMQLRRDAPDLEIGVAPVLRNTKRLSYSTIGSFGMFAASKHPQETALWLRFLTRPDNMKKFCIATNFLPAKKSVGKIYQEDPILGAFENEAEFCRPDVKTPEARQIMMILGPEIQAAAMGKKTAKEAIGDAAKATNAMLQRGK